MTVDPGISIDAQALLSRALLEAWTTLNRNLFSGSMRPPTLEIRALGRHLGRWDPLVRQISLSEGLVSRYRWGVVLEVLKHEMVHQYVHEVLGQTTETAHGPVFRAECARLGIDHRASGLPQSPDADPQRDKILGRVQRLLALAGSDNMHEAQSAMNAAQKLMLRFNVSEMEADRTPTMSFREVGEIRKRHSAHVKVLSGILGTHFFVSCIWVQAYDIQSGRTGRVLEICGTNANLEIAAYVHDFVLATAERLWTAHKKANGLRSNRERRRFLLGVMMGFGDSLQRQSKEHRETGLVWVGAPRIDAYLRKRHPHIRSGSGSRYRPTPEWAAGREQGRKIVVHKPITRNSRRGVRGLLGGG